MYVSLRGFAGHRFKGHNAVFTSGRVKTVIYIYVFYKKSGGRGRDRHLCPKSLCILSSVKHSISEGFLGGTPFPGQSKPRGTNESTFQLFKKTAYKITSDPF